MSVQNWDLFPLKIKSGFDGVRLCLSSCYQEGGQRDATAPLAFGAIAGTSYLSPIVLQD